MILNNFHRDWKIDGGDKNYILGELRIYVAHPKEGSTVGFSWGDWHPVLFLFILLYMLYM